MLVLVLVLNVKVEVNAEILVLLTATEEVVDVVTELVNGCRLLLLPLAKTA